MGSSVVAALVDVHVDVKMAHCGAAALIVLGRHG
eukprot:CAMPEP_0202890960 /NCGR_PEP_ID=MMETSP1392-20130828/1186_1 /ASSEMBLY_ACC=CAM_ASM_000868 /TAXON_ID=225041 /ORGANISM="Chlamydomonas chlamydogama, Strain SAG 11-48b" /LENGTH=33 /DNA_ID= /DNA_START= /DNA_END= /DNA_ORIENTATION=